MLIYTLFDGFAKNKVQLWADAYSDNLDTNVATNQKPGGRKLTIFMESLEKTVYWVFSVWEIA